MDIHNDARSGRHTLPVVADGGLGDSLLRHMEEVALVRAVHHPDHRFQIGFVRCGDLSEEGLDLLQEVVRDKPLGEERRDVLTDVVQLQTWDRVDLDGDVTTLTTELVILHNAGVADHVDLRVARSKGLIEFAVFGVVTYGSVDRAAEMGDEDVHDVFQVKG